MKKSVRNLIIFVAAVAALVLVLVLLNLRPVTDNSEKYAGHDLKTDVEGAVREGTYAKYQDSHADAVSAKKTVDVDIFSYKNAKDVEVKENYYGAKALYTGDSSTVTFTVDVPEKGLYNLYIEYLAPESRGVEVERGVLINGKAPFADAMNLSFSRIWTDSGEPRVDNQGNVLRPSQVEIFEWQKAYFKDDMGYVIEPYEF